MKRKKSDVIFQNRQFNFLEDIKQFTVFEIDPRKIDHLDLFRDNMYTMNNHEKALAVYTYEPIPPHAITKHFDFELSN